jgi:hypothetical protein
MNMAGFAWNQPPLSKLCRKDGGKGEYGNSGRSLGQPRALLDSDPAAYEYFESLPLR